MQAITTKYLRQTDHRCSRVKAECEAGSLTVAWDHSLGVEDNHHSAAVALAEKLGWTGDHYGRIISGGMKGAGFCHVMTGKE